MGFHTVTLHRLTLPMLSGGASPTDQCTVSSVDNLPSDWRSPVDTAVAAMTPGGGGSVGSVRPALGRRRGAPGCRSRRMDCLAVPVSRGLHSSTFQLNLRSVCHRKTEVSRLISQKVEQRKRTSVSPCPCPRGAHRTHS